MQWLARRPIATPVLITSVTEFERLFGNLTGLSYHPTTDTRPDTPNFLAHAVHAFFDNGGQRLYVSRSFSIRRSFLGKTLNDGVARAQVWSSGPHQVEFVARAPGSGLNGRISIVQKKTRANAADLMAAPEGSLLHANNVFYEKRAQAWVGGVGGDANLAYSDLTNAELVTLQVDIVDADGATLSYEQLEFSAAHPRWIGHVLAMQPAPLPSALNQPYALHISGNIDGLLLRQVLFGVSSENHYTLSGGNDGAEPRPNAYTLALLALE